ncbi:MAG: EamA family transporter [Oscillospiraceae bacterium]|nr:EamA family transporter [Oscillospiraceae bacterium]
MNGHTAVQQSKARASLLTSMLIFGTIGIFVRYIPLPSAVIAFARGIIGMTFLLAVMLLKGKKLSVESIKKNFVKLIFSGTFLGVNWILLFEAYRYTTVAAATLCYYMAPIIMVVVSPLLFGERLTVKKLACVAASLVGMVLVSGILQVGVSDAGEFRGIILGLSAAVFYASVVILNKFTSDIPANDKTVVQLGISALVLVPYLMFAAGDIQTDVTVLVAVMLLITGIVHTGVAYMLYFGSINVLKTQTVAIMSYIDPISAIILSAVFLGETLSVQGIVGAVLVLGAAFVSEMPEK